jgi:glycosyltransferase involved in cell wall biosynthesis
VSSTVTKSLNLVVLGHTVASPDNRLRWRRLAELFPGDRVTVLPPAVYKSCGAQGASQVWIAEPVIAGNYEESPLEYHESWKGRWPNYRGLTRTFRRIRPNVIYAIGEIFNTVVAQAILSSTFLWPRPKVLLHSNQNIPYQLRSLRQVAFERYVLRGAAAAVAENVSAAEVLRGRGFRKPVLVQAAPGASEQCFRPGDALAERRRIGIPSDAYVVGFVGGFRPEKGVADLVAAFSKLPRDAVLLLVGDGKLRGEIETQARQLGVMDRVFMPGFVPRSETSRFYQAMDVMVLPSRSSATLAEQFGNVLAEAMLCGIAVVGSTCGAIPDVIGDGGLVFPEGDRESLAHCLHRLRDDPIERGRVAQRGLQRALEEYSASALARRFRQFCIDLL